VLLNWRCKASSAGKARLLLNEVGFGKSHNSKLETGLHIEMRYRNGYKKRFIKKEKEEKAHYNDYMLMGKCIEYYIPFFINKVRVKCVENKKRERKQKLKVSKIALYNIFSN
jgi:hypothetical protein